MTISAVIGKSVQMHHFRPTGASYLTQSLPKRKNPRIFSSAFVPPVLPACRNPSPVENFFAAAYTNPASHLQSAIRYKETTIQGR
jgi:hypothetical protein